MKFRGTLFVNVSHWLSKFMGNKAFGDALEDTKKIQNLKRNAKMLKRILKTTRICEMEIGNFSIITF
jgi:hypothetical protein